MEARAWLDRFKQTRDIPKMLPELVADQELLEEIMCVVQRQETYPYTEYATWLLQHACKKHPKKIEPYLPLLVDVVLSSKNESVLRNVMACLYTLPHNAYREGELLERLLAILGNPAHKVALHVYALYKLIDLVKTYPELKPEILQLTDRLMLTGGSPALHVAIRKFNTKT